MAKSRRQFLGETSLTVLGMAGLLGATAAGRVQGQNQSPAGQDSSDLPPGAPPAFGTGPAVGPEVSATTFAEAEKLVQFEMTADERAVAAGSWRKTMAALYERRTGPRKVALEATLAPAIAVESGAAGAEGWAGARAVCAQRDRCRLRCLRARRTLRSRR